MANLNKNFDNMPKNYLFAEVASRTAAFRKECPDADIISLSIGDVTLPLAPAVVKAMQDAAAEMGVKETFRGYGPYEGYAFLREAIAAYYKSRAGVTLAADEIFVCDGAKNDLGAILDLFESGSSVLIPDPVYPAYVDSNALAGNVIEYADGTAENGFLPTPPEKAYDIVYICSPNNPTGAVYDRAGLKAWVDYANACGAVLFFDAAYESFIDDPALPKSIFEIEGARTCAIEFCSFSKIAGFTGTRCGYTVIPKELERGGMNANALWLRRAAAKYNGTPYIIQRGAEAVFSEQGMSEIKKNIAYYKNNAKTMADALTKAGLSYYGGAHSPYLWVRCPEGIDSWTLFDRFLREAHVVCTPGAGFGRNGEGYVRLTAFGTAEATDLAVERLLKVLG